MTFCTCDCITDRSIASYKKIFLSILVKDKLATPALHYNRKTSQNSLNANGVGRNWKLILNKSSMEMGDQDKALLCKG